MSRYCISRNLGRLHKLFLADKIFERKLRNSVFLTILEILWNVATNKIDDSILSSKVLNAVEKNRKLLRYFFDKKRSIKKRKSKFLLSEKKFKKFTKLLLKDFFNNCVTS